MTGGGVHYYNMEQSMNEIKQIINNRLNELYVTKIAEDVSRLEEILSAFEEHFQEDDEYNYFLQGLDDFSVMLSNLQKWMIKE